MFAWMSGLNRNKFNPTWRPEKFILYKKVLLCFALINEHYRMHVILCSALQRFTSVSMEWDSLLFQCNEKQTIHLRNRESRLELNKLLIWSKVTYFRCLFMRFFGMHTRTKTGHSDKNCNHCGKAIH